MYDIKITKMGNAQKEHHMKFLFVMHSGTHTMLAILEDVRIEDGTVSATQIGQFDGWADDRTERYVRCEPKQFIAGGGPWTLTEYTKPLL